jgi:hypothetical protein
MPCRFLQTIALGPNHLAAGKAGIARPLTIEHHCPGLPEPEVILGKRAMSLFNPRSNVPDSPDPEQPIPVAVFDLSRRYDLYCSTPSEDRLYENVSIIAIRTFERRKGDFASLIGGYLEIQANNGVRMMIPHHRIYMICEHGSQPAYKVLRVRKADRDE